jgi:hypothetical protein
MQGKKSDDEHVRKAKRPAAKEHRAVFNRAGLTIKIEISVFMQPVIDRVKEAMEECMGVKLETYDDDPQWHQPLSSFEGFSLEVLDCLRDMLGLGKGQPTPDDTPDDLVSMVSSMMGIMWP